MIVGAVALCLGSWNGVARAAEEYVFQHEDVLGTSCELRVRADSDEAAARAQDAVLAETDRLSRLLSTYDPTSEISRWLRGEAGTERVSPDLFRVLEACDKWESLSGGVFNARIESLTALWREAEKSGRLPNEEALAAAVTSIHPPAWRLDAASGTAVRLGRAPVSVHALAKGYIIDRAGQAGMKAAPGVRGLLVCIGGDMQAWGESNETIALADPRHPADNAAPCGMVKLGTKALATSGGYHRGFEIAGRHFSHLIDPRTGQPSPTSGGATVMAADATTADALATIVCLLPPKEALALVARVPGAECLLETPDGLKTASKGWKEIPMPAEPAPALCEGEAAKSWHETAELAVAFELNRPAGTRWLRPYVAVWVEDKDGFPVRTLALWIMQGPKGRRWVPDLRDWSKADRMRRMVEEKDIVPLVSTATRNAGKYNLVWDGLDDNKQPVKAGDYTIRIESSREKGPHESLSKVVAVGGVPSKTDLPGNNEIKGVTLDYRKKNGQP